MFLGQIQVIFFSPD